MRNWCQSFAICCCCQLSVCFIVFGVLNVSSQRRLRLGFIAKFAGQFVFIADNFVFYFIVKLDRSLVVLLYAYEIVQIVRVLSDYYKQSLSNTVQQHS